MFMVRIYKRSFSFFFFLKVTNARNAALPAEDFAASLGLPLVPKISFTKSKRVEKNQSRLISLAEGKEENDGDENDERMKPSGDVEKVMKRKNTTIFADTCVIQKSCTVSLPPI